MSIACCRTLPALFRHAARSLSAPGSLPGFAHGCSELLQVDGYIFATPENLAMMSGMMKGFFDRTYPLVFPRRAKTSTALSRPRTCTEPIATASRQLDSAALKVVPQIKQSVSSSLFSSSSRCAKFTVSPYSV